jgi:hypothetical protein
MWQPRCLTTLWTFVASYRARFTIFLLCHWIQSFKEWICFTFSPCSCYFRKKGKPISVTDLEGPYGCETSRLPHFIDNRLTYDGEIGSLRAGRPLPSGRFLLLLSVRSWVDPRAIVLPAGLGQFKKIHLIGTWTRDLPTFGSASTTTLPRAQEGLGKLKNPKTSSGIDLATFRLVA